MGTPSSELIFLQDNSLATWLSTLRSDRPDVRAGAVAAWAHVGEAVRVAIESLTRSLADPRPDIRLAHVQALRNLTERLQAVVPAARAALKEMALKEKDPVVRDEVVEALSRHLEPEPASHVPGLVAALEDELPAVRLGAASALADLGREARAALPTLIHAARWDPDLRVRTQAAVAIWRADRRDRIAVPVLIEALKAPEELLRWIAADCLGDIGASAQDALPALCEALQQEYKIPLVKQGLLLAVERVGKP
jgi:HEAT repeat protein